MELLSQDETRDFNSFLNSFGSTEMDLNSSGAEFRNKDGNFSNAHPYNSGGNSKPVLSPELGLQHQNGVHPSPYSTPFVYSTVSPQLSYFPQSQSTGAKTLPHPYSSAPYQTFSPSSTPYSQFSLAQPSPPLPDVTLLPYQTHQTAEERETEKQERMSKERLELSNWMHARGVINPTLQPKAMLPRRSSLHETSVMQAWPSGGNGAKEESDNYLNELSKERSREERSSLEVQSSKRFRTLSNCSGEEREDSFEADETMGSLREAELKAGFNDRIEIHSAAPRPNGGINIIPPSPKRITKPLKKTPIVATTKVTKAKAKPKARAPPPSPLPESDPSANPPPMITPSNIPPAPFSNRPAPITRRARASSVSAPTLSTSNNAKPALLSVAQKKANHIASEQKRRAAIRGGYEQLCFTVPSLRAAVEEFEERVKKVGKGKKSDKGALMGGIEVGGEKVDGRAGPRSEAVVLGKSVDHLRAMLHTRVELMERLSNAYARAQEISKPINPGPRDWDLHWVDEVIEEAD